MNQPPGPGDRTPSDNIPAPPPPRTLRHSARTRALQARDTAAAASGSSASHDALNLSALHTQIHPAPGGVHAAINKYRFAGELGRGGLGVVRLAEDTLLRREVAVKLVLDASNPQDTSAMVEEAQITGQLEHPNIVPVHELGTDAAGRPYMAMKRIQGRTLQQAIDATDGLVRDAIARPSPERLAEAQRSERQLLDAFIKVCDALAYAHSRRVIHRDLKPANVMVGEYGEVLVVDWGLARPIGGDARTHTVRVDRREQGTNLTLQGEVFGTPAYMPPEQASGNAADLDERSDVYSLGAILFTMLTGSAPFSGNVGQILERVARGQVPLPSKRSRGRDVPRELEAVVMTAMAADPADRYQSVVELKADVEAWLDGRRLAAADYSPWQLLGKWMRRHKAIVLTAGASAAALIVVVVLFILGLQSERDRADAEAATARDAEHAAAIERDHARTERDRAVAAEEESRTQAEAARVARSEAEASALRATDEAARAKAAEVDARRQLADSLIAQGDSLLISDRVPDAEERYRSARRILAEQHDPTFAADLALGNRYAVAPPELLTIHVPEAIMATGFCVDGLSLWCACLDGSLRVYDAATGVELRHAMHNGGIASACAVPDTGGTSLVATGGGDRVVRIWDTTTGREVQSLGSGLHTGYIAALAASADGRWIASGGSEGDNTIWIHDRQGRVASRKLVLGDFHAKTTSHARAVRSLAFSPDGTRLVSGSVDTSARVWDLQTDKALITLRPPGQSHVNTVAWTADGKRIITGGIDRMLHIWDAAAPTDPAQPGYDNLLHVAAHRGWVMCSAVTPDSRHILSGSRDHSLRLIDLATGESVRQFIGHDDSVNAVGLSGDGRLAVSGGLDGTLRVWTTSLGATRSEWSRPTNIARMVLSRDGRLCVTTSVDGRLDVRDVETGVRIYYQQAHNDQLFGAAFADDDSWVVVGGLDTRPLCRVYDLKTGAPLRDLEPPVGYTMFQLTPDSRMLVGGTFGGQIVAWDTATWSRLPPFVGHRAEVSGVVFNAAGTRMWSASHDATLIEWDVASRRPLRQARVHTAIVYSLALSPDERYIATGSHDQTAKLFDISGDEFREVHVLKGHRGNVRAVAFMPDGRHLLTASADATLRMHELATWREVRAWEPDDSEVAAVSVAPDGSFALVASAGTVRRLEFDYARQLEQRRDEAQTMRERVIRSRRDTQALLSLAGWYAWRDAPALALSLYEAVERAGAGGSVPTMALARACMQLGLNERAAGYLDRARAAGDIPPGYATALLGRLR